MTKIFLAFIIVIVFSKPAAVSAQTQDELKEAISGLYSLDTDNYVLPADAAVIISTERDCHKCYQEVCDYLDRQKLEGHERMVLVFMKKDYLNLLPKSASMKAITPCAKDILFNFKSKGIAIETIVMQPSPQLIIKTGDKIEYFPYNKVLEILKSIGYN
jgi:hypothetical protein